MGDEANEKPAGGPAPRPKHRLPRRATVLTSVVAIIAVYIGSLVGYYLLEATPENFRFAEPTAQSETVVIMRLRQMETATHTLTVDVLVHPGRDLLSKGQESVSDLTVRLSSWTKSGELIYVHGKVPANETTTLFAVGDPDDWPFDSYVTDNIGVQTSAAQQVIPTRIVVTGHLNGWDVRSEFGTIESPPAPEQTVRFTLERSRGALAFDIGLLLVLLTLPATALFVAIETVIGRRKFYPPLTTWFAAMLFAVVPLRNLLPGAPPAGAWIDQAVVLWVLIALAGAMVLYIVAWWRHSD